MTDEQWEIVNELRMLALGHGGITCAKAANEIERLEQELDATVDSKEQRALKAEMRCLALEEEIEHLNRRLTEQPSKGQGCDNG